MNIPEETIMKVALVKFDILLSYCHSMIEKQKALEKIKSEIFSEFNVLMNEVSYYDKWQRTQIGFAIIKNESLILQNTINKIRLFIANNGLGEVVSETVQFIDF